MDLPSAKSISTRSSLRDYWGFNQQFSIFQRPWTWIISRNKMGLIIISAGVTLINLILKYNIVELYIQILLFLGLGLIVFLYSKTLFPSYILMNVILQSGLKAVYVGTIPNYILVLCFFIALISVIGSRTNIKSFIKDKRFRFMFVFFLYCLVISLLMIDTTSRFYSFGVHWKMIFSSIIILFLLSNAKTISYFEDTIVISTFILSLFLVIFLIIGLDSGIITREVRIEKILDRNYFSLMLSYGVLITLNRILNSAGKQLKYILVFIFIILGQILLASRGGILTSSIGILYLISHQKGIFNKIKYLLIVSLAVFIFLSFQNTSFIVNRFNDKSNIRTLGERTTIWNDGLNKYANQNIGKMIFGGGYGHGVENLLAGRSVHNNYLEALFDYGIIGIVLFIMILLGAFKYGDSNQRSIVIATIIGCFTLSPWMNISFWLIMVYCIQYKSLETNIDIPLVES